MRWAALPALLVVVVACNSNNNGTNGHKTTAHQNFADVNPEEMRPGVFYCVRMSNREWRLYPCWRKLANCEKNHALALANGHSAEKCEQTTRVFCFDHRSNASEEWKKLCTGTRETCQATREEELGTGEEVTDCKHPEAHRRKHRQWHMARRTTMNERQQDL